MTGENLTSLKAPKLRFREFQGSWIDQKGKDLFENRRTKGKTDLPIYSVTLRNGLVPRDSLERAMREDAEITTNLYAKTGDLAYNMMRMWQGAVGVATEDCIVSPAYVVLAPKHNIDSTYFNYLLSKPKSIYNLWAYSYGLTDDRLRLYYQDFGRIHFYVPSVPEQQKIASFFSIIDEKIEKLKTKKSLLEQYKKGVIQKIFTRGIRFQDENGGEFGEWEEKSIQEIFDKVTRGNVLSMTLVNETQDDLNNYPVYSSQTKNNGVSGFYNEYLFENAITWTTDGANAGDVNYRQGKFYCTNVCGVLLSSKGYANQCISEMLNLVTRNYVSYVGNPKLMNNIMSGIRLEIPPLPEQQKIASFLFELDKKIDAITTEIESTEKWKKGLLQGMFV